MDSLGDMLKRIPSPDLIRKVEEKKAALIANPIIVKLRAKYPELTEPVMQQNMNRLYQYVTEYTNCSQCPGLERCPNDMQGHYTKISCSTLNGLTQVTDSKVSCKKYQAQQRQDQIRNRVRSFYMDERALNEGYSADEILVRDLERAPAANQVLTYIAKTKEEGLPTNGLYLVGKFGTGKTFLMCYLLHKLAEEGFSGVIVYMPEFVEDLKSMMQDSQKLKETIEVMKETDILIFDDVGAENMNPWARDHVLGSILNYRMNRKPTFYTSNYELDALEKHFSFTSKDGEEAYKGQRLMDRIRPFVDVIVVNGENKRGQRNK
ncbi:AAA family ATPase [Paenibacillus selenitireducens]|uniref:AAA family ATPase n=1 Tax=Paenibacillus selenitireducens TaxID=1324314 RepID=A0A1T2XJK4_9BACL|nr:primosomal protein DnaI [Paenibacillus selenitireducens]OPA80059.1 AAA family ATPase [Paenibacillus selenitireducens]